MKELLYLSAMLFTSFACVIVLSCCKVASDCDAWHEEQRRKEESKEANEDEQQPTR